MMVCGGKVDDPRTRVIVVVLQYGARAIKTLEGGEANFRFFFLLHQQQLQAIPPVDGYVYLDSVSRQLGDMWALSAPVEDTARTFLPEKLPNTRRRPPPPPPGRETRRADLYISLWIPGRRGRDPESRRTEHRATDAPCPRCRIFL